ncbi:MAG: hypothetical protein JWO98_3574 [Frankiales bacterium]|nr:hypothetical protein [Frankiales bacterium]
MGRHPVPAGSSPDADLEQWAGRVGEWAVAGQDVYVCFNNDGFGHAVRNAERLRALTGSWSSRWPDGRRPVRGRP